MDQTLLAGIAGILVSVAALIGASTFAIKEIAKAKANGGSTGSASDGIIAAHIAHEDMSRLVECIHRLELAIERQTSAIERQSSPLAEALAWAKDTHEDVQKMHADIKGLA
jgi:hypothetical protein